jgi:lysophospholipase L1-like esterase
MGLELRNENQVFKENATFCLVPGLAGKGYSFRSYNFPDHYLRHTNDLVLRITPPSLYPNTFKSEATFHITPPVASLKGQKDTVLLSGDSLTQGFLSHVASLPNSYHWINKGVFGDTADLLLNKVNHYPILPQPEFVFVMIGVNDMNLHQQSPNGVIKKIRIIVEQLKNRYPSSFIVIQSVLPTIHPIGSIALNKKIIELNSLLRQFDKGAAYKVQYLNLHASFVQADTRTLKRELTSDGLHLNAEGYKLWGSKLLSHIVKR